MKRASVMMAVVLVFLMMVPTMIYAGPGSTPNSEANFDAKLIVLPKLVLNLQLNNNSYPGTKELSFGSIAPNDANNDNVFATAKVTAILRSNDRWDMEFKLPSLARVGETDKKVQVNFRRQWWKGAVELTPVTGTNKDEFQQSINGEYRIEWDLTAIVEGYDTRQGTYTAKYKIEVKQY